MTNEQIRHMVNRFLAWKLPGNFNPDGGISFQPTFNGPAGPMKHEPSGTNLLDATQADAMVRNMLDGLPIDGQPTPVNEHALLNEFKMAAQSLIEVWSEGESVDYPEELQRHIEWFKELLA